jgi:hypothetical protein
MIGYDEFRHQCADACVVDTLDGPALAIGPHVIKVQSALPTGIHVRLLAEALRDFGQMESTA